MADRRQLGCRTTSSSARGLVSASRRADCVDYTHVLAWTALAADLWRRTRIGTRCGLDRLAGLTAGEGAQQVRVFNVEVADDQQCGACGQIEGPDGCGRWPRDDGRFGVCLEYGGEQLGVAPYHYVLVELCAMLLAAKNGDDLERFRWRHKCHGDQVLLARGQQLADQVAVIGTWLREQRAGQ